VLWNFRSTCAMPNLRRGLRIRLCISRFLAIVFCLHQVVIHLARSHYALSIDDDAQLPRKVPSAHLHISNPQAMIGRPRTCQTSWLDRLPREVIHLHRFIPLAHPLQGTFDSLRSLPLFGFVFEAIGLTGRGTLTANGRTSW
jgi:hypothetical protein